MSEWVMGGLPISRQYKLAFPSVDSKSTSFSKFQSSLNTSYIFSKPWAWKHLFFNIKMNDIVCGGKKNISVRRH